MGSRAERLTRLAETERLTVRAPQRQDLAGLEQLWTDARVTEHIGGPRDPAAVREHFEDYAADPAGVSAREHEWWWSVVERAGQSFVGTVALVEKDIEGRRETDTGYFLLPDYWRRGYAGEAMREVVRFAFEDLELATVVALIHPDNAASSALAVRLGMHFDRAVLRDGGVTRHLYRLDRPPSASSPA